MTTSSASADAIFDAAKTHFLLGLSHVNAGQLSLAEASFEAALALWPDRASSLVNLGVTRFKLGKYDAALPMLHQACGMEPRNRDAWWFQGRTLLALGASQAALDCLEQACAIDPDQALLWLHTSQAHIALNQNLAGLACLDQALALEPRNGRAWGNRGVVLRDLGRQDEAAQSFQAAIQAGADLELNTYYLGAIRSDSAPGAAPRTYVERLFDDYAQDFQGHLVNVLKYQGPEVLMGHLLKAAPRHYARALDVGCGSGLCGPLIRPVADHLAGLDISSGMLEVARQTGVYDSLVHADAVAYLRDPDRLQEPKFDLVVAADVLIYVGALEPLFHAVAACLRPPGQFCLTVELMPTSPAGPPVDMRLLPSLRYAHSQAYLRRAATEAGFAIDALVTAPLREEQGVAQMGLYVYLSLSAPAPLATQSK